MPSYRSGLALALAVFLSLGLSGAAYAAYGDEAPAPRKMPRTPVKSKQIADDDRPAIPPSRALSGTPTILDTERLTLDGYTLRLFGIVPPHISASFGPQARAALDTLSAQGIDCKIRDRDRDGRLLATCQNRAGADIAHDLLRRGLAVTARGSLQGSDIDSSYRAAESAAQAQGLGLWSIALPAAASDASIRAASQPQPPKAEPDTAKDQDAATTKPVEPVKADSVPDKEPAKADKDQPKEKDSGGTKASSVPTAAAAVDEGAPAPAKTPVYLAPLPPPLTEAAPAPADSAERSVGFWERYQLLVTGLLMLVTALSVGLVVLIQKWTERREELRSIAAALRGEMMAARALCVSRMRSIETEQDDRAAGWPRIRTLVFQAYVGRLGRLGAELARQIASIYGQASDYASYFGTAHPEGAKDPMPKRQALHTLARHIDDVLPRLAAIEHSRLFNVPKVSPAIARPSSPPTPMPTFPSGPGGTRLLARDDSPSNVSDTSAPHPEEPKKMSVTSSDFAASRDETTGETHFEPVDVQAEGALPVDQPHTSGGRLWNAIRKLAGERRAMAADSDLPPEYTALTEDELAALSRYHTDIEPISSSEAEADPNSVLFATSRRRA